MPDRFSGDRATQAPGQRSSEAEPMDRRKTADGAREHDGMQPETAPASARSNSARGAKAWSEGKQTERTSERSSTLGQSALPKLESMLAKLDKPWTVLHAKEAGSSVRSPGGLAFIGLHPEKGIALIDVEPARPSHAVAGLRVALLRAQNAGFTVREPPIVPVVLSRGEIPNFMARIEAAFAEMPRCAIQNRDWPELAVDCLTAENAQLVRLERRPKAAPSAPAPSKPEAAKRAEAPPITVERDAPERGKGSGNSQQEAHAAAAPRRDPAAGGEARHANGSSAYPSLLRRPDIEPPRIDSSQLDMSRMMRSLKPPPTDTTRTDTKSRPEQSRPTAREPDPSPEIRDAASDGSVPPPKARVIPLDRMFDPAWNPSYPPPSRGRGRGWTVVGALFVMLAALVVLPPQAIGPASSIRSTADAPAQHGESRGDAALQPPRFATGQGSALGERLDLRELAPPPDQHAMKEQEPPLKEGTPPAPATANMKPPIAAPTEAARPAPDTNAANVAKGPAESRAPSKAASAEATKDRANATLAKPVQKKPSSASARPAPAARKSAPKDSQKAKDLQEASSGMALPSPTARKPAPKSDKQAQDGQDTSGAMTYVEGREPRILGTITSPSSADSAYAPQGNDVPQGSDAHANIEARPAARGPLSPATDFSITPEGVMAPSGVVMPFDRQ